MTVARVRGLHGDVLDGLLAEFEALVMRILRRIAAATANLLAGHSHASVDDLAVIPAQWVEAVDGEVMPALAGVYRQAAAAVVDGLAAFGHDVEALRSPEGADFMAEARNRLVGIGDAVWEAARDELVEGMQAGEDIGQLAARVAGVADVSQARATVIARTECLPASALVDGARVDSAYRRWYCGELVEIETKGGRKFAGTPNHPMLTTSGWVALGALTERHNLICHTLDKDAGPSRDVNEDRCPTSIGEIFETLSVVGILERRRTGDDDFHGDGRKGNVDVASAGRVLSVGSFSPVDEPVIDRLLPGADSQHLRLALNCPPFLQSCLVDEFACLISAPKLDPGFVQDALDEPVGHSVGQADGPDRLFRDVSADDVVNRYSHVAPGSYSAVGVEVQASLTKCSSGASMLNRSPDGMFASSDAEGNLPGRQPVVVETDNLASLIRRQYSGHVFNLTTIDGYFISGGFYTGNTIAANNAASYAQALMLDDPGMTKAWLATPDQRTRETHRIADGQSVPLREPFEVGGFPLLYPGDPTGPVEETAGCRCAQAYDLADAPVVASFDEGKIKRDGHGRFAEKAGGGGFSAWLHDTVSLDVGTMVVGAADEEGRVTLNLNDGAAHTSLSGRTATDFAYELESAGSLEVGRERVFANYPPGDDSSFALSYASIKRISGDTFEIDLSNGDGSQPPEGSTFTISKAEAAALAAEVWRLAAARKASTSVGDFAAILERSGQITTKWPASAGTPITLNLSVVDADKVAAAIKAGVGAIDEWDPELGPDDVASRVSVELPGTTLTVTAWGRYGEPSGRFELESSAHDWVLRLPDVEMEHIGGGLEGPIDGSDDPTVASASSADFHLPGKHDQMSHAGGRAGHTLSNALKTLIPDDQDDDSLSFSEDDGRYFDWSSRDAGSGIRSFEVGDADGETVQMGLQQEDMRQLASALSITLLRDQAVPPNPDDRQSMLLASLLQAGQRGGVTIGDSEDVDDTDRNFDWSTRGEGGSYHVEISANGETAQLELTPDEMAQLHAQLVRTLLADERPVDASPPVVAATDGRRHAAFCRNPLHPGPCKGHRQGPAGKGGGPTPAAKKPAKKTTSKAPTKTAPTKEVPAKKDEPPKASPPSGAGIDIGSPRRLEAGIKSGVKSRKRITAATAEVDEVVFKNGTRAVRKTSHDAGDITAKQQVDAATLAATTAQAFGVTTPAVHRINDSDVYMEYMDGPTAYHDPRMSKDNIARITNSSAGRILGLFDLLIDYDDRSWPENWAFYHNHIVALDHDSAWSSNGDPAKPPKMKSALSPFSAQFADTKGWKANDLRPDEIAAVRQRLVALRPQFAKLDRADWHDFMTARFEAIAAHATAPPANDAPTVAAADPDFCRNPLHPGPCAKPGGKAYKRRHRGGDGPTGGGEEPKQETPKAPAPRKGSPKKAVPAGPAKYTGPRYVQPADVDAKAVTALRKRFHVDSPEAWSQGHVSGNLAYPRDDETEQLINQVGPTVATRLAWEADNEAALARLVQLQRPDDPNIGPYDDLPAVTDAELAQVKKAAGEQLREDFAGKAVSVRLTGESLDRVLDDGRFKTQFETKRSGGGYLPTKRAAAEKMMFGLDEDTDPKVRPVYGYLPVDKGPNGGGSDLLDTYGDVQVVLKDSVRSRTTASVGDSLDRQVLPSPVDDPSWESFNGAAHWSDGVAMDYGSQRGILYLEAQVHGGVGVEDIESVAFTVAPSAATKKRLSDLGIPWRMR